MVMRSSPVKKGQVTMPQKHGTITRLNQISKFSWFCLRTKRSPTRLPGKNETFSSLSTNTLNLLFTWRAPRIYMSPFFGIAKWTRIFFAGQTFQTFLIQKDTTYNMCSFDFCSHIAANKCSVIRMMNDSFFSDVQFMPLKKNGFVTVISF